MKPSRSWCYTINNYSKEDIEQLESFTCSKHRCAKEIGASGTQHLQGTISFKRAYRLPQLKKLNSKAHWEPAKTSDPENYCTKGEIIINTGFRKSVTSNPLKTEEQLESEALEEHYKQQLAIAEKISVETCNAVTRYYKRKVKKFGEESEDS